MSNCSPWLYYDKENHIWRFFIKDDGELMYSIMYEENKWTKAGKIDSDVLDFAVDINEQGKIYITYSVKEGKLKYCIWEDTRWLGRVLYSYENLGYQMREVKVKSIAENMHIFFIARNKSRKNLGILMHLCCSGEKSLSNVIYNISLIKDTYSHYEIEISDDGKLSVLFISNEEKEAALRFTEYKNQKWSSARRLYGINGSDINFCTLQINNKINILNFSKEDSIYSLEHVLIENDGRMRSNKIYEGTSELYNCLLMEKDGILFSMWAVEDKIFYSSYKGQWNLPAQYEIENNKIFTIYSYISSKSEYKDINAKNIMGTMPPEIKLILPEEKEAYRTYKDNTEQDILPEEQDDINPESESIILKKTIRNLENKMIALQIQLQKKQRIIEESNGNFIRLTNEKKNSEEKLNIITEIQQSSIKELEETKRQLTETKSKLEEAESELSLRNNYVEELKDKIQQIIEENTGIKRELEYEKNKGFVDRIFKKTDR